MRLFNLERVKQPRHVQRLLSAICLRISRLATFAGPARVERDDSEIPLEVVNNSSLDPTFERRGASVKQDDWLAFATVDVVDLHPVEIRVLSIINGQCRVS